MNLVHYEFSSPEFSSPTNLVHHEFSSLWILVHHDFSSLIIILYIIFLVTNEFFPKLFLCFSKLFLNFFSTKKIGISEVRQPVIFFPLIFPLFFLKVLFSTGFVNIVVFYFQNQHHKKTNPISHATRTHANKTIDKGTLWYFCNSLSCLSGRGTILV